MSWPVTLLAIYCTLIALSALFGGFLPSLLNLTHRRMQYLVSLIGGLMLGVGFFHQFPHACAMMSQQGHSSVDTLNWCIGWMMGGLLTTFFMLRMFHFHHHEAVAVDTDKDHLCGHDHDHDHGQDCLSKHDHDHDSGGHHHSHHPAQGASWVGVFFGLTIHSLMDGVALAANVTTDALADGQTAVLLGLATFLGIVLHKPLDSLSIMTLMTAGGWSFRARQLANFGYALMCPAGAIGFYLGVRQLAYQDILLAGALAFSAGVFICISLSDLLPEVQFHSHDRLRLSAALLIGVLTAYLLGFLESGHMHGHGAPHSHDTQQHGHGHRH